MSYQQNYTFSLGDSSTADAFGRARVSSVTQIFDGKNPVFSNEDLWANYTYGPSASCDWDSSTGIYTLGGSGATAHVIHRTRNSMYYQTGKSPLIMMTFDNLGGSASIKRVGYYTNYFGDGTYNELEGLVLENNMGDISFNIYNRGATAAESFPISSWMTQDFDPLLIDWNAPQLMTIDYEWLGAGRVRFGLIIDGKTCYFVYANHANHPAFGAAYMTNPNLFLTYEFKGGTGYDTFKAMCSTYAIEGQANSALGRNFSISNNTGIGTLTAGTKYAALGYRMSNDTHRLSGLVDVINMFAASTSTVVYSLSIVLNPTLAGTPSWITTLNSKGIPVDYSAPNTSIVATGGTEIVIGIGAGSNAFDASSNDNMFHAGFTFDDSATHGVHADEIWFCVTPLSGAISASAKVYVSANLFLEAQ